MYKTLSKRLQRGRDRGASEPKQKPKEKVRKSERLVRPTKRSAKGSQQAKSLSASQVHANLHRAPHFEEVATALNENRPISPTLPAWLLEEIAEAGGPEEWISRNLAPQRRLRQEYALQICNATPQDLAILEPAWLRSEIQRVGFFEWLAIHAPSERRSI